MDETQMPQAQQSVTKTTDANLASVQQQVKPSKESLSIPLAIVFAGFLIAAAVIFSENTNAPAVAQGPVVPAREQVGADTDKADPEILALRADDHILGSPTADIVLIEYSDTECPFCKIFHDTMIQVVQNYGSNGSVAWVYRHFPLEQIHPRALKEAEALECAADQGGNEAFWKYLDQLFKVSPTNNKLEPSELPKIAQGINLNVEKFNTCLSSGKFTSRVQKDFNDGVSIGVRGTPHTIIWNRKTGKQIPVNGALPYAQIKSLLGAVTVTPEPATSGKTDVAK